MLESINQIGSYIKSTSQNTSILDLMINKIPEGNLEYIMEINITQNGLFTDIKAFRASVTKDALFYQAGNAFLGGGLRLDFYKESKVKGACNFCEAGDRYEEIKKLIEDYIGGGNSDKGFAILLLDGRTPRELFEKKFLDKMFSTIYKKQKGVHKCQLCGAVGEAYNTAIYKFYTNDKELYGDFTICADCVSNILTGKEYIESSLSCYWINNNVMFLPHEFNEEIETIYSASQLGESGQTREELLKKLRESEADVLDEIGRTNTMTDIVFYEKDGDKTFYIYHTIQSVLPSRFSAIAKKLREYKLWISTILEYTAAVKIGIDKTETTGKERIRMLDALFGGKKIDRSLFFKRAMNVYKMYYMKSQKEQKKNYAMSTINRIYNLLCDCGCLEKGWRIFENGGSIMEYKNYSELFEQNQRYFDTNEKKAWFILGRCYNNMIFRIKDKREQAEGEDNKKTSLEKNFFFARKFNFDDFIYFSNLLEEKAIKYNKLTASYKIPMTEAKLLMANREGKLSQDEAKYIFFWGMDSYFGTENDDKNESGEEI